MPVSGGSVGGIYRHGLPFGEGGDPDKGDLANMRRGRYGHIVDRTALFFERVVLDLFVSNKCYVNLFVNFKTYVSFMRGIFKCL